MLCGVAAGIACCCQMLLLVGAVCGCFASAANAGCCWCCVLLLLFVLCRCSLRVAVRCVLLFGVVVCC